MTIRKRFGLPAVAAAMTLSVGLPIRAAADDASSLLHVMNKPGTCSDAGTGTTAQPFCTVQAAVDAAHPGQTVLVHERADGANYAEQVTVRNSGTPGHPITIEAVTNTYTNEQVVPVGVDAWTAGKPAPADKQHAFVLNGVHDVTIRDFYFDTAQESVLVTDSARITVDRNRIEWGGPSSAAGIRLTGTTADSTVSRNSIGGVNNPAITVDKGVTGSVITTNAVTAGFDKGILVTGAPGTVVTSNTVEENCGGALVLTGGSTNATVENNILTASDLSRCPDPAHAVEFTVAADSTAGTKADYNIVRPAGKGTGYTWGGTAYQTPAAFAGATQQGAHDLSDDPALLLDGAMNQTVVPEHDGAATDSGDATAPGVLDTDVYGKPRLVRDIARPDHGVGGPIDRGAAELPAFQRLDLSSDFIKGPHPLTVTVKATIKQSWADTVSYSYDFGDGSTPVTTSAAQAQHTYAGDGSYNIKVTANGTGLNSTVTSTPLPITVSDDAPLTPVVGITRADDPWPHNPLSYHFDLSKSTSPWSITGCTVDFGDGTSPFTSQGWNSCPPVPEHTYRKPGDYTVSVTMNDAGGRKATVNKPLNVAYPAGGFKPITPTRLVDTRAPSSLSSPGRLGPGQSLATALPVPTGSAAAVVLNITAVDPDSDGYLSVRPQSPDISTRPTTSNLNIKAGHNVANLVTVPVGDASLVSVYNAFGHTDVVVDAVGYYQADAGDRFTALTPSRVLDTRQGPGTPLGPNATTSLKVRGVNGVSDDATAVVLNLTSTGSDAPSFLTAYPGGTSRPGTSNVNFEAGQTVPNQVIVPIGADGTVTVYNHSGNTHVVADLFGYYSPTGNDLFTPVLPSRLLDTRQNPGTPVGPGQTVGITGLPADADAAVLNVTSTESSAGGYFTLYPHGIDRPLASNLNFAPGQTVANHVTVPVGQNGQVDLYNRLGNTHAVADLFGYFTKG